MTSARRPTLVDVAAIADVDKAIVSRVLNSDPTLRVRDDTRRRVLAAVEQLGYRRNAHARSLRVRRATAIGLVIPTYDNPVYTTVIHGAALGAQEIGSFLLTASLGTLAIAGETPADLVTTGRIDGLLLAGHSTDVSDHRQFGGVPVLCVNRRVSGFDRWLVLDDEGAARIAVDHLLRLGHRRIAHLAGPPSADTADRRRAGFHRALASAGVFEAPVVEADYTSEGGAQAASQLLSLTPCPTAIVVANVASAVGALSTLHHRGIAVPHDLSIVAIHDLPLARYLEPALTVVEMPLIELGRRGVELLMTTPADSLINEVVRGPMSLIERDSTAPPSMDVG